MVNPIKVVAIWKWQQPRNANEVGSFLGLTNFYKKFIKEFSKIALPLTLLTRQGKQFEWTEQCEKSFQELKEKLTCIPVLTIAKGTDEFVIYSDASKMGLGMVLMHHDKVVAYASR